MLHGIRGTGKTTTARVLAKCLNCVGIDGHGSETPDPCGVCDNCTRISADNHIDVIEMDAASHTGVDDIREVIESSRYKPVSARFKVFIIDEVHMLSKSAFNALLKTLEEPPPHVKFILATTELHKVPETVLSRCMRFDLERIGIKDLTDLYQSVAQKEGYTIDSEAVGMITKAADGSARDGMSILDQAINTADGQHVSAEHVRKMLGLVEQKDAWGLLFHMLKGEISDCLSLFETFYHAGGDPLPFVRTLLENTHDLMTFVVADRAGAPINLAVDAETLAKIQAHQKDIGMDVLYRLWAILLKGYEDIKQSPLPYISTRILLMKVCYAADLPTTREILQNTGPSLVPSPPNVAAAHDHRPPPPLQAPAPTREPIITSQIAAQDVFEAAQPTLISFPGEGLNFYRHICNFVKMKKEVLLYSLMDKHTRFIEGRNGYLKIAIDAHIPDGFSRKLKSLLDQTGTHWIIDIGEDSAFPTLAEHAHKLQQELEETAKQTPLVQEVLKAFPEAHIVSVEENSQK